MQRISASTKRLRAILCVGIVGVLCAWVWVWPYSGGGDAVLHYRNLRESALHAKSALHPWARPGFVALLVLPALGGMVAARCFAAVLAGVLVWQTMRLADDLDVPHPTLAPAALLWQPLFFPLAADTMTEMPMALALVVSMRLWLARRHGASCLAASFLPLLRPEGFFLVPMWAAMVLASRRTGSWRRRLASVGLLGVGMAVWCLACGWITGAPLYWHAAWSWPRVNYTSYGHGDLLYHVRLWPYYCGPVLLVLWLAGLRGAIRRRMAVPWAVWGSVFIVHSVLWWQGWFGSAGLMRIQAMTAPVTALVCLHGWSAAARWLARRGAGAGARVTAGVVTGLLATAVVVAYYAFDARRYRGFPVMAAAREIRQRGWDREAPMLFAADPMLWAELGIASDDPRVVEVDGNGLWSLSEKPETLSDQPPGTVGLWDDQLGRRWYRMEIDRVRREGYEAIAEYRQSVPRLPFGWSRYIPDHSDTMRYVLLRRRRTPATGAATRPKTP